MEKFLQTQRRLLEIEHAAELEESTKLLSTESNSDLQTRGIAILGLSVSLLESGLFGKTIVTLVHHLSSSRKFQGIVISPNSISSGDIVGIFSSESFKSEPMMSGVVHAIGNTSVRIVLDNDEAAQKLWDFSRFNLAKIGSNLTHVRLMKTVDDLERSNSSLKRYLLENVDEQLPEGTAAITLRSAVSERLNEPQKQAVLNSLTNPVVTLIQGPPGTGKTTTIASFIAEAVMKSPGIKILACAPSNVAVDNLAMRVVGAGVRKIVRVGHPTRMAEEILQYSLDARVQRSDFADSCCDIRREIQGILDSKKGYSALKELRKDLKEREAKSIEQIVNDANVIFTTCNGSFNLRLKLWKHNQNFMFDLCVIDECAQGLEMSSWIPILQCERVVLAGDHKQLAATIHSKSAENEGLAVSLFERCFARFSSSARANNLLSIQYRMNSVIMGWSNSQFYKNLLIADSSVASETLKVSSPAVINGVDLKLVIESPFVFCDSVGVDGMAEDCESSAISKSNFGEVHLVKQYADLLVEQKIANNIAIITPYAKQVELLRQACPSVGEVSTVDSFQGREADVVIISLVRSNLKRQVGFLADSRRLNVAITRARRQVFVIGDSETISADPVLKSLFDYACNSGLLISAQTLVSEQGPQVVGGLARQMTKKKQPRKPAERPRIIEQPIIQFGETDDIRKNLRRQILLVPEGEKQFFPNTLSSAERRHIHSLCDQMGLSHGSTGEGSQRQVWIHKKVVEEKVSERAFSEEELSVDQVSDEKPSEEKPEGTKPLVKTKARIIPSPAEPPTPGICPHVNCKMSVRLVSVSCLHCKREFCVAHAFPELHGCGDAAKKAARKPVVPQQGKGGIASRALRTKMNAKLDSLQAKRSTTSVPKKK